jgi:alkylated DNA repair protein (DNA oxidative demethylase)
MSLAMTNCGRLGWVSDRTGYRYTPVDPDTGAPCPPMPAAFIDIAHAPLPRQGSPITIPTHA